MVVKKAAKYYRDNIDVIKKKDKNKYRNLSEKEKKAKKAIFQKQIQQNEK